jgi:hypothetical protein
LFSVNGDPGTGPGVSIGQERHNFFGPAGTGSTVAS